MDIQSSVDRRKQTMSNTIESLKKDLSAPCHERTRPSLEKISTFIGKPVTLNPAELRLDENIRRDIDTSGEEYLKLKESISNQGILQSILVEVRVQSTDYELICVEGHRRTLVAQELGIERVPCILAQYSDNSGRTKAALAASIKEDLHPLDRAEAFHDLIQSGLSIKDISSQFERDERTVRRYLKMAKWDNTLKDLIRENKEKFSTRFLFQKMAQTDLDNSQLEDIARGQLVDRTPRNATKPSKAPNAKQESVIDTLKQTYGSASVKIKMRKERLFAEVELSHIK